MKFVFTFLILLTLTSFSADLVCKVIDFSKTSNTLSQSEEDEPEESQNEEDGTEGKMKLREFEYVPANEAETNLVPAAENNLHFFKHLNGITDQHEGSVPFSPPEMS